MAPFDPKSIPVCAIDFPLDISPNEIADLAAPINTLLKAAYLLGDALETDLAFQSLYDIAGEIAGVEACGVLFCPESSTGIWGIGPTRLVQPPAGTERPPDLTTPAMAAVHFGKPVLFDSDIDPRFAPACSAWSSRSLAAFPLRKDRDFLGALIFGKSKSHPFTPVQIKLLWNLELQASNFLQRGEAMKTLSLYAILDPLTHLYNRRYFDLQLEKEIVRSRRSGGPVSVLLIDVDNFREYNTRFRQAAGDIALQEFAGVLTGSVREVDTVTRLGADEFGIIVPDGDSNGARVLADRIVTRFSRHLVPGESSVRTQRLSASVGIATFPSDCFDKSDLLRTAEQCLSAAKAKGGGTICNVLDAAGKPSETFPPPDFPVQKIYDAARSVVDMEKFLEILLFTGMQGLSANRGSIVAKGAEGTFSLCAAIGFARGEDHLAASKPFRPGPITDWVVEHQIPLVISQWEDCPIPVSPKRNGYQTDSFLSIPLVFQGQSIGVLHLTNRKNGLPFTREDLLAFAPIASEIATILSQGMEFRKNVRNFALSILSSLSDALELRFPFLAGRSERVRNLSVRIGERMGMDSGELDVLRHAAALHDIGILGVPSEILNKTGRLSNSEIGMIRKHTFLGAKMLEGVPEMDATRRAILEHHEHYNGSGYPFGLRGDDICRPARILSAVQFYDAIVTGRPHRGSLQQHEALQLLRTGANTLFDPEVCTLLAQEIERAAGPSRPTAH